LDPSVFAFGGFSSGTRTAGGLFRLAAGPLFRFCDANRAAATHVHLGGTAYLAGSNGGNGSGGSGAHGLGAELEIDRPVTPMLRLGGRLGVEYAGPGSRLVTLGARLRIGSTAWIGLDGFHVSKTYDWRPLTGAMVGAGLEGHVGTYSGLTLLGAGLGLGLLALVAGASAR